MFLLSLHKSTGINRLQSGIMLLSTPETFGNKIKQVLNKNLVLLQNKLLA